MTSNERVLTLLRAVVAHGDFLRNWDHLEEDIATVVLPDFPHAASVWTASPHSLGQVLTVSFPDDERLSLRYTIKNDQLTAIALNVITPAEEATPLGEVMIGELIQVFGSSPDTVTEGDSGSYSWTVCGFVTEVNVFGVHALYPHGVLVVLARADGNQDDGQSSSVPTGDW